MPQLRGAGCEKVFREVASGARVDRSPLQRVAPLNAGAKLRQARFPAEEAEIAPAKLPNSSQHLLKMDDEVECAVEVLL